MNNFYFHQTNEQIIGLFEASKIKKLIDATRLGLDITVDVHLMEDVIIGYVDGELQVVSSLIGRSANSINFVFSINSVREIAKQKDMYIADVIDTEINNLTVASWKQQVITPIHYVPVAKVDDDNEDVVIYQYSVATEKFNSK